MRRMSRSASSHVADAPRHQDEEGEAQGRERGLGGVHVRHQPGDGLQRAWHTPGGRRMAQEGADLQHDEDDPDAGHEPRDDRVRHQRHVLAEAQHAEGDLDDARQHHHCERHGHALVRVGGQEARDDGSHDDRHGLRRLGDEGGRAAEQRREEPHEHGTVEARLGASAGGDPEGECHGQGDDGGGHTAEEVAPQVVEAMWLKRRMRSPADRAGLPSRRSLSLLCARRALLAGPVQKPDRIPRSTIQDPRGAESAPHPVDGSPPREAHGARFAAQMGHLQGHRADAFPRPSPCWCCS